MDRRDFLKVSAVAAMKGALGKLGFAGEAAKLPKAVGLGMVGVPGDMVTKFKALKEAGFQGVEVNSPGAPVEELVKASKETGIVVHSVVDSVHWQTRLSDPDPAAREKAVAALIKAIEEARLLGATAVLLVPGVVRPQNESYEQVWERSIAEIRKAIPIAEKNGIRIAIEPVWNNFITKSSQLVQYVDEFKTPVVGAYFDTGNMVKFGEPVSAWIRALGKRMVKLHIKSYSNKKQWVPIGEGDEDWPEVVKAIREIGYTDFATAEVGGGGMNVLKDIAQRMDKVLGQ